MSHKYGVSYRLECNDPPMEVEEARRRAEEEGLGSCDAAVLLSILFPEDGSYSVMLQSLDGRTGRELSDHEVFKAWWMLAERLGRSTTLEPRRAVWARATFEMIGEQILGSRPDE